MGDIRFIMFIRIEDYIINTDNITSIAKDTNGKIRVNFVNGKYCCFVNMTIKQIQDTLSKVDKIEDKVSRLDILDL